jgi:hypothetical protein
MHFMSSPFGIVSKVSRCQAPHFASGRERLYRLQVATIDKARDDLKRQAAIAASVLVVMVQISDLVRRTRLRYGRNLPPMPEFRPRMVMESAEC